MKYLFDTNICIYTINYKPISIIRQITSKQPDEIAISSITIAELEYGVSHSKYQDTNRIALLEFLIPFQIIDFDQIAAISYGLIRNELEANGKLIGPMDLLLAAQALSRDLILVTNNEREFNRISNLKIENWYKSKKSN